MEKTIHQHFCILYFHAQHFRENRWVSKGLGMELRELLGIDVDEHEGVSVGIPIVYNFHQHTGIFTGNLILTYPCPHPYHHSYALFGRTLRRPLGPT